MLIVTGSQYFADFMEDCGVMPHSEKTEVSLADDGVRAGANRVVSESDLVFCIGSRTGNASRRSS